MFGLHIGHSSTTCLPQPRHIPDTFQPHVCHISTISQHHGCYMRMETRKLVNMFIIMSGTCQSYTSQVLVKCLLNICILSHIYATYQPHVYHILATCMPHISHIYATSPPYVCHILDKPQPHVFHNSIIV